MRVAFALRCGVYPCAQPQCGRTDRWANAIPAVMASIVFFWASSNVRAEFFIGLGTDPTSNRGSDAFAVSADGSTVVGRIYVGSGSEAFRWTFGTGMDLLGHLAGGNGFDVAYGVSGDGSLVVGYGGGEAFEWTQGTGMVALPSTSSYNYSAALAVSADGSAIVGYHANSPAILTTSAFGPSGILGPGQANGVSGDGSVVVGLTPGSSDNQIFRWTSETGMVTLGNGYANAISQDGSTIVGSFDWPTYDPGTAFRWTASTGIVDLFTLPGTDHSEAYAVSGNGSVIVGRSFSGLDQQAFIWDAADGMRSLQGLLTAEGADLAGWQLTAATGISADGLTITGTGIDPSGENEAWVAQLNAPVPEPSALALWFFGALVGLVARIGMDCRHAAAR